MNYRHAFHAGNHADVLKHVVLLALCDALTAKPAPLFALDTHAGRGRYRLRADAALRTGEADEGIERLLAEDPRVPAVTRYLAAVRACRKAHGSDAYPGSPWLLAHALREQDRIACCEIQPAESTVLAEGFEHDRRVRVLPTDGYAAMRSLLPPRDGDARIGRGLVLIDPPYETQLAEFDDALAAIREGLRRFPQGVFALWYPIKLRRTLGPFQRRAADLPAKSVLVSELLVRPDDSPLRMNGSGLVVVNAPWKFDAALTPALAALAGAIGGKGASSRVQWLRGPG